MADGKPKQVETLEELTALWKRTNLCVGKKTEWNDIKDIGDDGESHIYVPQCSYFGSSNVMLSDDAECTGEDCFFLQELVRLFREGRISLVDKP